jgi:hypothetical protein
MTNLNHLEAREHLKWGTYGKNGNEPLRYIIVKDLENSHLQNIISHIKELPADYDPALLRLMEEELAYRVLKSFKRII